jgi:hypothetical protein
VIRPVAARKRNNHNLRIEFIKLCFLVTQLRDMLTAGQSAQMPQKYQQHMLIFR